MQSRLAVIGIAAYFAAACQGQAPAPQAVRLVDLYRAESHAGVAPSPASAQPLNLWKFVGEPGKSAGPAATFGFEAVSGIADLRVRDGALVGRTTAPYAVLHLVWPEAAKKLDGLHALELRLRVTGGKKAYAGFGRTAEFDLPRFIANDLKALAAGWDGVSTTQAGRWNLSGALAAPGTLATIELTSPRPLDVADLRHILVRPTDEANVEFEIESLRAVERSEHLARTASGLSFQGLGQIYHETLVERPGETMRFALRAPQPARFEAALGTVTDGEVRFRVGVERKGAEPRTLLERTLTRPHRWEPVSVELGELGGKDIELTLEVKGRDPSALAFWGSPALRATLRSDSPSPHPRHVILVMADTLRRGELGCYGSARAVSPNIDRLAAEGARLERMTTNATWTKVASPTLLTGLYPPTHGVREQADHISAAATTVAEVFRGAGFATLSFASVPFSGRLTNLHQGFEELHESISLDLPEPEVSKTARDYVDRLLPWLDAHRDVPAFVFLHLFDPHDPFEPRRPYSTLWADPAVRAAHVEDAKKLKAAVKDPLRGRSLPWREDYAAAGLDPEPFLAYERAWYDGSIRGMDAEIGRLVERLHELRLDEDTLVAFVADHGEEFLEHGRAFHGQSVYAELADVPFILWAPGRIAPQTVIPERAELVDVMPTLLELAGLEIPSGVQGRSLVPLLGGERRGSFRERPVFVQKARTAPLQGPSPAGLESFAVLDGRWKLIHAVARDPGAPEFELYDTEADPADRSNVADRNPAVVAELEKTLAAWQARTAAARLPADQDTQGMSEEEVQRLRSLGYIH
jgi:arylsulfatase A-like enzyme